MRAGRTRACLPRLRLLAFALAATVCSEASLAHADDVATTSSTEYSALEKRLIERSLADHHGELEPEPAGKVIEAIEYERFEVFDGEEPIPPWLREWLNAAHTRTKEWVVRRELLVGRGEPWNQVLLDETTRNLRNLPQISVALAVPMKGSAPGKVRLLMITRDVWSIRLQWDVQFIGGQLNYLLVQPTEQNVAGIHHQPQVVVEYRPLSWTVGTSYTVARIGESRIGAAVSGGVLLSRGELPGRDQSQPEGVYSSLDVGQPLFSHLSDWAWDLNAGYRNYISRRYQNGELKFIKPEGANALVPYQYRQRIGSFGLSAIRSFGTAFKNDFSVGFAGSFRRYNVEGLDSLSPEAVALFTAQRLPVGEDRVYPYARWRTHRTDYFRTIDVESLSVQEDFRLGHDVYLEVAPVTAALGSTRSLVAVIGGAMWTSRLGDGLLRASVEGAIETQTNGVISDAWLDAKLAIVSPRMKIGRLTYSSRFIRTPDNYLKRTEFLGGDTRLRGYPSSLLFGDNLLASNLEFRTPGFYLWGVAVGGVAFYDAGDAFTSVSKLQPKHSVGLGLRFLLPFFDEVVYRLDFAYPLNPSALPASAPRFDFIFAVEQAFAFPDLCANATGLQIARQCP